MSKIKIIGDNLKNVPWQDRPEGCEDVIWRHNANPIIDWNPTNKLARVYNSAVVPYNDGFIGIFRAENKSGKPHLYLGTSLDGLKWDISDEQIEWKDEKGEVYAPAYSYDPRLVKIENTYYIIWCTDFGGASLAIGMTKDFKEFVRLENPMKLLDLFLM